MCSFSQGATYDEFPLAPLDQLPAQRRPSSAEAFARRKVKQIRFSVKQLEDRLVPSASPFTPGDLVVERIGTGSSGPSHTPPGTAIFLDEYSPTGVLVQSVALPTAAGSGNTLNPIVDSGSASTQGLLTLSANGSSLVVPGYDAPAGTASITSSTVPKVIGIVGENGSINTTTTLGNFQTSGTNTNMHGAASPDGTNLYASAKTALGYTTLGSTANATQLSATNTNLVEIFGNNTASGLFGAVTGTGIVEFGTWGSPLPTSGTPTATTIVSNASTKPFGFFFATLKPGDISPDTLYVADGTNGLEKFSLTSGTFGLAGETWTLNGTITTDNANNYYGLTGVVSGTTVTLYATTNAPGTSKNQLLKVVDTAGWNATFSSITPTVLASAAMNELINGVALAQRQRAVHQRLDVGERHGGGWCGDH